MGKGVGGGDAVAGTTGVENVADVPVGAGETAISTHLDFDRDGP